ncbi:MAG: hypothetical protein LBO66_13270 [Deltaproteobacteria bacterium]|jgi:uncharacterized Zn finger protein|nr:hypothetical protein [Deltaproteobacteria bacterium]
MPPTLKSLLAPAKLADYGYNRSYERGREYYQAGAVLRLAQRGDRLSAVVAGSRDYKASIRLSGSSLSFSCTCPADGFCKHLVATALAWNAGEAEALGDLDDIAAPTEGPRSRQKKGPDIRAYLMSLDRERLADMILNQAVDDSRLRDRLSVAALAAAPDGIDLAAFRQRIDRALEFPDFDYDNPYWDEEDPYEGYAEQLRPILDALESLLDQGQYASVAHLAEYSLAELNQRCLEMEYDFLEAEEMVDPLVSLHLRACRETGPNPEALAEWLFQLGFVDTASEFPGLPWERYEDLLGETGIFHFRRLLETEWRNLPAPPENGRGDRRSRQRLRAALLRFAENDNDVEAQAAIIKTDLSDQDAYLELARAYSSAQRYDEALKWAEKGWNDFDDARHGNSNLRDFLAEEYRRRDRVHDALTLYWNDFFNDMDLSTYKRLTREASRDQDIWPRWREKALESVREMIAESRKNPPKRTQYGFGSFGRQTPDNSLLVEILLWENKPAEAWDEAVSGGCDENLWLRLSGWRERSQPQECLPIWERRIERLTRHANQSDYAPAADSLAKLGELMEKIGERPKFIEKMKTIRASLKRRASFMRELNQRNLP